MTELVIKQKKSFAREFAAALSAGFAWVVYNGNIEMVQILVYLTLLEQSALITK